MIWPNFSRTLESALNDSSSEKNKMALEHWMTEYIMVYLAGPNTIEHYVLKY